MSRKGLWSWKVALDEHYLDQTGTYVILIPVTFADSK